MTLAGARVPRPLDCGSGGACSLLVVGGGTAALTGGGVAAFTGGGAAASTGGGAAGSTGAAAAGGWEYPSSPG